MMKLNLMIACIFWLTAMVYWPEDLPMAFIAGAYFYQ
jgi:hypothetical protein